MRGLVEHLGKIFQNIEALIVFEGMQQAAPGAFGEKEGFAAFKDRV